MYKDIICGIYSIENVVNHKKYIGQSINIKSRWCKHKVDLNNGSHDNDYLQKSWNKYGENNFEFEILEECSKEELNEKERYYIDLYNTMNRDYGYNLKSGGQDKNYVTEYVKNKISESNKKYYEEHPEVKKRRSINAYEQWSNPEIKAKIIGKNNGMYGKTHSDEARKKISEAQKGHVSKFRNTTPVLCVETNKTYECAAEAQKEINTTISILEVCKGNRKTAGGYHWQFVMENNI